MLKINSNTKTDKVDIIYLHQCFLNDDLNGFEKEINESFKYFDEEDFVTLQELDNNTDKYKAFIHFRLKEDPIHGYHLGLWCDKNNCWFIICTFNWYARKKHKKLEVKQLFPNSNYYRDNVKYFIPIEFDEEFLIDVKKKLYEKTK